MKIKLLVYFFLLSSSISFAHKKNHSTTDKTETTKETAVMSTVSIEDVTVFESDSAAIVPVTIDVPDSADIVISISTMDNTAVSPDDYAAVTTTVTIPAGQTTINVNIPLVHDIISGEINDFFTVNGVVVSGNTNNTTTSGTVTIIDTSDSSVYISDVTVNEADGVAQVPVSINGLSMFDTVVQVTTIDSSATAPDDYTTTTVTVTIPILQTTAYASIPITDDNVGELPEEFEVTGTVVSGYVIPSNPIATVTILDEDTPSVNMGNMTVQESIGTVTIPITLSNPSDDDTVISVTTADGSAVSPNDYTATSTTVTIPATQTSTSVSIAIVDDTLVETTENFTIQGTVTSGNTSNSNSNATVTITDQDDSFFSIGDVTIQEEDGIASVPVSIDTPSTIDTVISITTIDNTATDPNDYTSVTVTATIPAGQVSISLSIPITDDNVGEPTEDFTVNGIVTSGNTGNPTDSGTITIIDNDTPIFSISNVSVNEGDGTAFVAINITNPSAVDTIIAISLQDNGATIQDDYTSTTSMVAIPAGQVSVSLGIPILDDFDDELDEDFYVYGIIQSGNTQNPDATGIVTIIDNDDCNISDPTADCDGDGVTNEDELNPPSGAGATNPEDPCDFNEFDITLPQTGDYLFSDCDGDGVTNGDELNPPNGQSPTDPNDSCDFNTSDISTAQSGNYFFADCDGDGVTNGDELNPSNGATPTNQDDPCDFNPNDISLAFSGDYLTVDCDGDGVLNGDELNPPNGGAPTDETNICDFNSSDITQTISEDFLIADCDGDGTLNGLDCDPFNNAITDGIGDACDDGDPLTLSDFLDENCNCIGVASADVDGDGIPNQQEVIDGTDYNDACDPVQDIGYTGYDADNSVWQAANCDNDDINNASEVILGTDPYDTNYNTIQGSIVFDVNGDGCNGTDDIVLPNVNIAISDGTTINTVFTDDTGDYSYFTTDGTYNIAPYIENLSYFTVAPTNISTNFPSINNSVFNQDFCITSNGVNPDVEVIIAPIQFARPGFDAEYLLTYRNKGNQIVSGAVSFTYDDTVLDFVSSTTMPTSQATGSLNWNYANLTPFESRSINITLNVNAPTETPPVFNGDELSYTAMITPVTGDVLPDDNQFDYVQTVVGSYDPNDITCVEGSIVNPTEIGEYLHYIINFENTGTFFAENIIVTMDIDPAEFDINTLRLLNSSHDANVSINGNIVQFVFQNIFLPVDGQGNLLIKMKTLSSLVENDIVSNQASIFFDYNFPIITNNADTTFAILSTPEFVVDSSITIYPNPTKNDINITANNTIKSILLYDMQGRILMSEKHNAKEVNLDISNQAQGVYFVKISTEKGVKTEKIVKM